jgi:hypothetical protein
LAATKKTQVSKAVKEKAKKEKKERETKHKKRHGKKRKRKKKRKEKLTTDSSHFKTSAVGRALHASNIVGLGSFSFSFDPRPAAAGSPPCRHRPREEPAPSL